MTNLEQFIYNEIVTTSSEVVDYCVNTLKITEVNARKRIQRLNPEVFYKFKGICSKGKSILYHKDQWTDDRYYDNLLLLLRKHAKQHYFILNAIKLHYGRIEKIALASYSVSPILHTKGHKDFKLVINDLKTLRLIEEKGEYISSFFDIVLSSKSASLELVQKITMSHFHEWARNIGLFSYNSAKFNSEFSRYQFGIVAPSFVKSLVSKSSSSDKIIPAYVLADILLDGGISEIDVDYYIKKLENISMQNQQAKFLPFFITNTHNQKVYKALKSNGVIVANVKEIFGEKYAETINGVMALMENAGAILKANPEQYVKLIDNIEKLAIGKTFNLKGELFEMNVGLFHSSLCQNLDISKKINYDNNQVEIDVYAKYQDKVVFAECKGYNRKIDDDYIEDWIKRKIPIIRRWALECESLQGLSMEFEIWCTGGFEQISIDKLDKAKNNTKKYSIEYYDIKKMCQIAQDKKVKHFERIIKAYYAKEI